MVAAHHEAACVSDALNAALMERPVELAGGDLRFVPQSALPDGEAYEAYIRRTACVPTRDNLHDLFNGLQWLSRPALKRRLNELQAHEIAQAGVGTKRGPLRDALTLFDENAALLQAPQALVEALRLRQWHRLFVTLRPLWREARLEVFGHALLEKLVQPYKSITAHVFVVSAEAPGDLRLEASCLVPKPFLPLPVLGVPGWWPQNEDPSFYDDTEVFRP
ncbi:DUF3025 domain-containing protein [Caldimonas mangrovi]|nr:DUF3025 domain-containing protein [Caldimonas mangrovi]